MATFDQYVNRNAVETGAQCLDQTLFEIYKTLEVAQASGYLSWTDRQRLHERRSRAIACAVALDVRYREWRLLFGFDPSYKGLHRSVQYMVKGRDFRLDNPGPLRDIIDEKEHTRYRRQAQKRLGRVRRRMWSTPEPFNATDAFSAAVRRIEDAQNYPSKRQHVTRRASRDRALVGGLLYALRGDHAAVDSQFFPFCQALAVGSAVRRR